MSPPSQLVPSSSHTTLFTLNAWLLAPVAGDSCHRLLGRIGIGESSRPFGIRVDVDANA